MIYLSLSYSIDELNLSLILLLNSISGMNYFLSLTLPVSFIADLKMLEKILLRDLIELMMKNSSLLDETLSTPNLISSKKLMIIDFITTSKESLPPNIDSEKLLLISSLPTLNLSISNTSLIFLP